MTTYQANVPCIATTNWLDRVDAAAIRLGRIDLHIALPSCKEPGAEPVVA